MGDGQNGASLSDRFDLARLAGRTCRDAIQAAAEHIARRDNDLATILTPDRAGRPPVFKGQPDWLHSLREVIAQSEQIEFADRETQDSDEGQRTTVRRKGG